MFKACGQIEYRGDDVIVWHKEGETLLHPNTRLKEECAEGSDEREAIFNLNELVKGNCKKNTIGFSCSDYHIDSLRVEKKPEKKSFWMKLFEVLSAGMGASEGTASIPIGAYRR